MDNMELALKVTKHATIDQTMVQKWKLRRNSRKVCGSLMCLKANVDANEHTRKTHG
jgi:hypothetical protein